MRFQDFILPALALGAVAMLIGPSEQSLGFTTVGGSLSTSQRDVRVFNNFADAAANDNTASHASLPGYDGAEQANWRAIVEWGSRLHGDGNGDFHQNGGLGSGGANFDPTWQGNASGAGSADNNIISATNVNPCGGGVLAFTEAPISDGWRIRYCEDLITWQDGPGTTEPCGGAANNFDMQGVGAHEYGHALGLGHTGVGGSTMNASTNGCNSKNQRSIGPDDIAGVQFIYGVASASKPIISSVSISGMTITITGSNFSASGNEVWFTNLATTGTAIDPRVIVSGVVSSGGGTSITAGIPTNAGPGDVLVKAAFSGNASLSNAFPADTLGPGGGILTVTSITPGTIDALMPGTGQTVSINGTGFLPSAIVQVNGSPQAGIPSPYTVVNSTLITLDMPQVATLGNQTITVVQGAASDSGTVNVAAPATPKLQTGNGDLGNALLSFGGLDTTFGGAPGCPHLMLFSLSNVPSVLPTIGSLDIGNNFTQLIIVGIFVIQPAGWTPMNFPLTGSFNNTTLYFQSVDLCTLPLPVVESNFQEVVVIL